MKQIKLQLSCLLVFFAMTTLCLALPKHVIVVDKVAQPPKGKALINFHRPSNWGGGEELAIFDINGKMLVDLFGGSVFQYVCEPGEVVFLSWAHQVSVIKGEVSADKIYDIMVDSTPGWVRANTQLVPLKKDDVRRPRLAEFEQRERRALGIQRTDHVTKYEEKNKGRVEEIKKDFLGGSKSDRVATFSKDDCR